MVDIPAGLKQIYNDTINNLIDSEWGVNCSIIQPPVKSECPNCILNTQTNVSSGRYKSGGPVSFSNGETCPYCLGDGYKNVAVTNTVRMLVYLDAQAFLKESGIKIAIPAGTIATKGKIADFNKIDTCDLFAFQPVAGIQAVHYAKHGKPTPIGIGKDSFFFCLWVRA